MSRLPCYSVLLLNASLHLVHCYMTKLVVLRIIVATARSRYESLKKHTQDELKHTIDAMLDTETKVDYVTMLTFHTVLTFVSISLAESVHCSWA